MKVYVLKDCVDASKQFHAAGSMPELDAAINKKLFDLKLVEEYDKKKHGESKADLTELQKAKDAAEEKVAQLQKALDEAKANQGNEAELQKAKDEIQTLIGFVKGAMKLGQHKAPDGWTEYIASKE
jgi:multidrug resistance efflux pump